MSSKLKEFSRRGFLRGTGQFILPLPLLGCMLNSGGDAMAQNAAIQPFFLYAVNGLSVGSGGRPGPIYSTSGYDDSKADVNLYFPKVFGNNYQLSDVLAPMQSLKEDFNLITNLRIGKADGTEGAFSGKGTNAAFHTYGLYCILSGDGDYGTGATSTIKKTNGEIIRRTSVKVTDQMTTPDRIVFDKLGQKGKLLSLHVEKERHGSGSHESISYTKGKGEIPQRDLNIIFDNLFSGFSNTGGTNEQKNIQKIRSQSVLDLMLGDYNEIKKIIGREDKSTLESHFTKIEELEKQVRSLASIEVTNSCSAPAKPNIDDSAKKNYGNEIERAKILNTMITMAASCRITQSVSYGITHSRTGLRPGSFKGFVTKEYYKRSQPTPDGHALTHDGNVEAKKASREFNRWQTSVYADLISKFKNVKIGNDTLLDHSNLLYIIESGYGKSVENGASWHSHSGDNMIAMNAGGKKLGMKLGKHVDGKKKHPMAVVNSAMATMGITNPKVGKVSSKIDDII